MGAVAKLPLAEQWASRICTQMGKSVESILDIGRLLIKAKSELAHGEWGRMFDDQLIPFGVRTAEMLMSVALHPVLSNTKHVSHLPASWGTLYALTQVPDVALRNALRDGVITPDMERKAVQELVPRQAGPVRKAEVVVMEEEGESNEAPAVIRDPLDVPRPSVDDAGKDDPDSTVLYHLKRYWRQATKKDRKAFRSWIDES